MIVVDTSAIIEALTLRSPNRPLLDRLIDDGDLRAPHLLDVEFLHALRRLVATGRLSEERAEAARFDLDGLSIVRYPHQPLADRIWALRRNLSAYDAAFVALAEALGVPLVTCDGHLSRAGGHQARIELFSRPFEP